MHRAHFAAQADAVVPEGAGGEARTCVDEAGGAAVHARVHVVEHAAAPISRNGVKCWRSPNE